MNGPRRFIATSIVGGYALAAALTAYVVALYDALPDVVAVDFGADGQPIIGPKERLLTPLTLMIGVGLGTALFITAIVVFRHTIVERYPYLINLPALTLILGRIDDEETKRQYIDKLFVPLSLAPILVLGLMILIAILMLEAARTFFFDAAVMIGLTVILIGAFLAFTLSYYRSIYKQVKAMVT